jgi:hypothetical protein
LEFAGTTTALPTMQDPIKCHLAAPKPAHHPFRQSFPSPNFDKAPDEVKLQFFKTLLEGFGESAKCEVAMPPELVKYKNPNIQILTSEIKKTIKMMHYLDSLQLEISDVEHATKEILPSKEQILEILEALKFKDRNESLKELYALFQEQNPKCHKKFLEARSQDCSQIAKDLVNFVQLKAAPSQAAPSPFQGAFFPAPQQQLQPQPQPQPQSGSAHGYLLRERKRSPAPLLSTSNPKHP